MTPDSEYTFLTYEEAARTLGIKSDSVRRRAAARRWPRRLGNDGLARVGLPVDLIRDLSHESSPEAPPALPPDITPDASATDELRNERDQLRIELAQTQERLTNTVAHLSERLSEAQKEREREVAQLREIMAEIREDRDAWRAQATTPSAGLLERLWLSLRPSRARA